ncbi:MAG: phytochelatin synthase family protein [Pseudomonadota bacterium]
MKIIYILILSLVLPAAGYADIEPDLVYWNSEQGKILRTRIAADADYWQLSPGFTTQNTQTYCSVASAVTVLNGLNTSKPVDPAYAPYPYFTQNNFFTPEVTTIITPQTVLAMGMTRDQMAATLASHGAKVQSLPGDQFSVDELRGLLQKTLLEEGHYVLANYLRASLGQQGGGHWSVLAAMDSASDRVLILDVAKYKYPPVWVTVSALQRAIATVDRVSHKARGLVLVAE